MSKPISAFMQLLPSGISIYFMNLFIYFTKLKPETKIKIKVDGVDIPDQPLRMMAEGNFQPKPIMQGVVSEEAVLFFFHFLPFFHFEFCMNFFFFFFLNKRFFIFILVGQNQLMHSLIEHSS